MALIRSGWPFFVAALAFLLLAGLAWHLWPTGIDPCGSARFGIPQGVPVDSGFCSGKRTTVGAVVPIGFAALAVVVGALGLVPSRPPRR